MMGCGYNCEGNCEERDYPDIVLEKLNKEKKEHEEN